MFGSSTIGQTYIHYLKERWMILDTRNYLKEAIDLQTLAVIKSLSNFNEQILYICDVPKICSLKVTLQQSSKVCKYIASFFKIDICIKCMFMLHI